MRNKKIYLYKMLLQERKVTGTEQIDLFSFAVRNNVRILIEDDLSIGKEDLYFVIYPDLKSCIVIHNQVPYNQILEWIGYALLKILILKKFGISNEDVEIFKDGSIVKTYSLEDMDMNSIYFSLLCEILIPSSQISLNLYKTLNYKKIDKLAKRFSIRPVVVEYKIRQLYKGAYNLLNGISFSSKYNNYNHFN